MRADISIELPASSEALAIIDAGLDEYSAFGAVQPLHVIASSPEGRVIGGAVGRTWGKCCELQQLWISSEYRGNGEGTRLMDAFEREAARRGCELVYLDTFSFQAPAFYLKRGYVEVLRTDGFTREITKITMHKRVSSMAP